MDGKPGQIFPQPCILPSNETIISLGKTGKGLSTQVHLKLHNRVLLHNSGWEEAKQTTVHPSALLAYLCTRASDLET